MKKTGNPPEEMLQETLKTPINIAADPNPYPYKRDVIVLQILPDDTEKLKKLADAIANGYQIASALSVKGLKVETIKQSHITPYTEYVLIKG